MSHQPNNVFAGTHVVSLAEVRGTNNSLGQLAEARVLAPTNAGEYLLRHRPSGCRDLTIDELSQVASLNLSGILVFFLYDFLRSLLKGTQEKEKAQQRTIPDLPGFMKCL